jgi:hypothetical protein
MNRSINNTLSSKELWKENKGIMIDKKGRKKMESINS